MVIGTIVLNIVNAVLLTIYSSWKPQFYYSFKKFKEMFSFTSWSMIEAVSIWLTSYVDVFEESGRETADKVAEKKGRY